MKLILSTYLRTLKERDEFDVLMPDLLFSMGIIPLTTPQAGTRQYGVDLPAVGVDEDGVEKLFLFVLKMGDIDRHAWNSGLQSVRPSLDEIIDVYLSNSVPPKYFKHPVKIILSTTGDCKETAWQNWLGYIKTKKKIAEFDFWGADEVAMRIEKHMLNEHLFKDDDRMDLRRTLALIGEPNYSSHDFHNLLLRQLGLGVNGDVEKSMKDEALRKALIRVNMATRLVTSWAIHGGDTKTALIVSETALLWSWHRLQKEANPSKKLISAFMDICGTYVTNAANYIKKIRPYCIVKDGFFGQTSDSVLFSLIIYEHIGLLASIGLFVAYCSKKHPEFHEIININDIADTLIGLISNNPASGSPRLDEHSIDITLALIFLMLMGKEEDVHKWLIEIVKRTDYCYAMKREFPVDTDKVDDLIELANGNPDQERREELMQTSWTLPTLAGWCAILGDKELYKFLVAGLSEDRYPDTCRQLWHPVSSDIFDWLYFRTACKKTGEAEAPIEFEENLEEYSDKMNKIVVSKRHQVVENSPAYLADLFGLDFIANRHFRNPVAPSFWYRFLPKIK